MAIKVDSWPMVYPDAHRDSEAAQPGKRTVQVIRRRVRVRFT